MDIIRKHQKVLLVRHREYAAELGFGTTTMTLQREPFIVSHVSVNAYRLACGDVVTRHEGCGAPCSYCLEIYRNSRPNLGEDVIEWLATSCVQHTFRCFYAACGRPTCLEHGSINEEDENWYCLEHFNIVEREFKLTSIQEEYGIIPRFLADWLTEL